MFLGLYFVLRCLVNASWQITRREEMLALQAPMEQDKLEVRIVLSGLRMKQGPGIGPLESDVEVDVGNGESKNN